jgi:uncharacterized protein (DUF885 family)
MNDSDINLRRAQAVIDQTWQRVRDGFRSRFVEGRPIDRFPDLSEDHAERTSKYARATVAEAGTIDIEALPHDVALTLKLALFQLGIETQAVDRYWLAQTFCGHPAMFPVTPYGGGYLFSYALKTLTRFVFSKADDRDRYLALIEDYTRLLRQIRRKLRDQAVRGIRVPRPALGGARQLVTDQLEAAKRGVRIDPARIGEISTPSNFTDTVARLVDGDVLPAFHALLEELGTDYADRAPETVGLGQFDSRGDIYEALIAQHLSMPRTVESVHRAGHERMAQLEAQMEEIRSNLSFSDREKFHHYLLTDPAWVARTEADLQGRFDAAISRIEGQIDHLFHSRPAARYRTERLDPRLEAGMTYGFYRKPMSGHPDGVYYFNASNLSERTLATAASLIFHELVPGHHFHMAGQSENELLHPLRQNLTFVAFNEGWAEYAATLAGEVGMYADPCEQYGRLLMDAFLTCRLVVDTGMNALGWTLDAARQYMRRHTVMSEAEIRSETLRYATDIPAQSLAYKIGEFELRGLRERAQAVLGNRFDLRDFHDAILGAGAMPLQVLDWHVSRWFSIQSTKN